MIWRFFSRPIVWLLVSLLMWAGIGEGCAQTYRGTAPGFRPGFQFLNGSGQALYADLTQGSLPSWLTASGGANGTVTNSVGNIVAASAPRFDYTGGTANGLLIEEQRTNLILQSNSLATTPWVTSFAGGAVAPALTNSAGTSPDGSLNASKVIIPAVGASQKSTVQQMFSTTSGASYALSVYLKGNSGGENIYIYGQQGSSPFAVLSTKLITLTNSWAQYVLVVTANQTSIFFSIGIDVASGTMSAQSGGTIFVSYTEAELGAFQTSVIGPTTTTAVTRSADVVQFAAAGAAFLMGNAPAIVVETGLPLNPATNSPVVVGSTSPLLYIAGSATSAANAFGGTTATATGTTAYTPPSRFGTGYTSTTKSVALNGGTVATASGTGFVPSAPIYLGSNGSGAFLDGPVRKVAVYTYQPNLQVQTTAGAALP